MQNPTVALEECTYHTFCVVVHIKQRVYLRRPVDHIYMYHFLSSVLYVYPSLHSLMKAAEDFDNQLNAGGRSTQLVKAVDSRLRKQTQELHVRCNKVSLTLIIGGSEILYIP